MAVVGRAHRTRRVRVLQGIYRLWLRRFAVVAVVAHAVVIVFFAPPAQEVDFDSGAREIAVVEVPPETKIPPPPEEIVRPATPVLGSITTSEELTIAETEVVVDQFVSEFPVTALPPPPEPVVEEERPAYAFTPYTVKPKCRSGCDADEILRHVPPLIRRTGMTCALTVGIRIDKEGNVTATDILRSSGIPACDQGVSRWALTTSWTTAYNRDQPVVVWIAQPIEVVTR